MIITFCGSASHKYSERHQWCVYNRRSPSLSHLHRLVFIYFFNENLFSVDKRLSSGWSSTCFSSWENGRPRFSLHVRCTPGDAWTRARAHIYGEIIVRVIDAYSSSVYFWWCCLILRHLWICSLSRFNKEPQTGGFGPGYLGVCIDAMLLMHFCSSDFECNLEFGGLISKVKDNWGHFRFWVNGCIWICR